MDEGDLTRAVVGAYASVSDDEARELGQAAAAAVLPLRRRLWALAERLVPERLAAALRARCHPADQTGAKGVRELRTAIADWLDPPPVCRWCHRPLRGAEDNARECSATRARARLAGGSGVAATAGVGPSASGNLPGLEVVMVGGAGGTAGAAASRPWTPRATRTCKPSRTRRATGAVERCGTLALYPAGSVDLATMAAALAVPKGAASGYDVAADRDCRALLAATCPPHLLPYPVAEPWRWSDEAVWRLHAAVAEASHARAGLAGVLPRVLLEVRTALQRARDAHQRINGRIGVGIQRRYFTPTAQVCRADLVQGAAIGNDRAVLDYDAAQAKFTTYGANWARQGCGEAWHTRDLVGSPPWLLDLRRQIDARLAEHGGGSPLDVDRPADARDLLRAVEALAEAAQDAPGSPRTGRRPRLACALAEDLAGILGAAHEADGLLLAALVAEATPAPLTSLASPTAARASRTRLRRSPRAARAKPSHARKPRPAEDPERARERVCAVIAGALELRRASGSGLLAALRHGAPVLVQVGAGSDDDDETQGTDGAGGHERRAAVLVAPDDADTLADEAEDRARWGSILAGLATLRASAEYPGDMRGAEAAEVVRRHHGLDSVAEETGGSASAATGAGAAVRGDVGESFASIGATGLHCSGRTLTKEAVRKIYLRALEALQALARGSAPDLGAWDDGEADDCGPVRVPRSPFRPVAPAVVAQTTAPPQPVEPVDGGVWAAFREAAASVTW